MKPTSRFAVGLALLCLGAAASADPLLLYNGRLFIPARVNDVATEALLDSGAEATIVDPILAAKAGLSKGGTEATAKGSGGTAKARIVEGATLEALGLELHPQAVVVLDLTDVSKRLVKRPTQAIVGRELFDSARLKIDIDGGDIAVLEAGERPRGRRLALTGHAGIETIPVLVNGSQARAEFDLGNGTNVLISRRMATRLHLKTIGKKQGGGVGGAVNRDLVRLASLKVGDRTFRNVVAAIDDLPNAGELNVGTSILKHFVITTAFEHRAVWLQPERQ